MDEVGGSSPSGPTIYYTDGKRHLICVPYSIENLHEMARRLGIKRCWFHKDHYDIPKRRIKEIEAQCDIISSKKIVDIIRKS
jgi:FMN phosphatase YigB (HAD superfamily)